MSSHLSDVDDALLRATFDAATLSRGRGYADDGRVELEQVDVSDDGTTRIDASVYGGEHRPYAVEVLLLRDGSDRRVVFSDCTCFVQLRCKHGVAALLVARAQGADRAPGTPAWGRQLGAVLDELDRHLGDEELHRPLALQFALRPPPKRRSWHTGIERSSITVRPMQQGARDNWIKTGASWTDAPRMRHHSEHAPDQAAILADLAGLRGQLAYYASATANPSLEDFGAGLWLLLQRAREAGIELIAGPGLAEVELLDTPASLAVDAVAERQDGVAGTVLQVGVRHAGRWYAGADLLPIGRPGHGVALLGDPVSETGRAARGPTRRRLLIAPLARQISDPVRRLLDADVPVHVPREGVDALVTEYLPRLRRHLPVTSSDDSVPLPREVPPELLLRVHWGAAGTIALGWEWRYRLAEDDHAHYPLDSTEGIRSVRNRGEERRQLLELDLAPDARRLLADHAGSPHPRAVLTGTEVLEFVTTVLPALHEHPGVEVIEDGTAPDYREAESAPEIRFEAASPSAGGGAADSGPVDWLDLDVVISVDGESVPLPDVLEALTLGRERIFLPSGLHIAADHPALTRIADLVRAAGELAEQGEGSVRVGRHDLGLWGELAELGIVDAQAAEWVRAAQALRDLTELPAVDPVGLTSDLRSYQLDGFRWLAFLRDAGLGGILADDMGLGKTLQALAVIQHARREGSGPFLVVAPTSVVSGWAHEAARHTPGLDVRTITASRRRRGTSVASETLGADIVVTSYTLLRLEIEEYVDLEWGGLVLDEAQQVKNHQGKTYQAVRRLETPFRLALTGTPFENRLMELWSLLSIVAPGLYPWPQKFTENVVNPVEKEGDAAALARFRTRVRPFLLRRTKDLVASDLPAKQEQVLEVPLHPKHRKIYDTHLQRERQNILGLVEDFQKNRMAIFSSLTRLRQLSLDAALVDPQYDALGSAKLDVLAEHLVELVAEGHRALVFSQFTSFLRRVRTRLDAEGIDTSYLDGTTRDRGAVIEEFKQGKAPVFLISLKAGGVGLTLTEADYVFVLDPWWNPAVEAQAVDRAHRIGQTRPVMVYRLVATDTIEEKVMLLKQRKAELFAQVLDGDGAMGTTIGAEDVRALFED